MSVGSGTFPVCPECGNRDRDEPECPNCGHDLTAHEKLPLRNDWLADRTAEDAEAEEAQREAEKDAERFELSPVAVGVALLGAALIVLGLFLPANENPVFSSVEQNTSDPAERRGLDGCHLRCVVRP